MSRWVVVVVVAVAAVDPLLPGLQEIFPYCRAVVVVVAVAALVAA
jgi:hypothetical protein